MVLEKGQKTNVRLSTLQQPDLVPGDFICSSTQRIDWLDSTLMKSSPVKYERVSQIIDYDNGIQNLIKKIYNDSIHMVNYIEKLIKTVDSCYIEYIFL